MSGRPIRKDRFELLDELGIGYVCKFYVEGNMSVQSLCEFLFDPTKHGRVGVSVLYLWISERGYRGAWDRAVALILVFPAFNFLHIFFIFTANITCPICYTSFKCRA